MHWSNGLAQVCVCVCVCVCMYVGMCMPVRLDNTQHCVIAVCLNHELW